MPETLSEEELLEFLYACPIGLIECNAAGDIGIINPHAMQHLLPLVGTRDPNNLFSALEQHAPELRGIAAEFAPTTGRICDGHRIVVDLGVGKRAVAPKVLACTLVKLGPDRLMATLSDISQQVVQEQRLRQADTWFATLLNNVNDYATLDMTPDGKVAAANACFTRQTGFEHDAVVGRNLADVLGTELSNGELRLVEQVEIAGRDGWHLQEGRQKRADGSHYWCQRLVVARLGGDDKAPSGFSVVLRDVPRRDAAAADLQRLLLSDPLTGVSNRRHFSQSLKREHTHWRDLGQSLSVIMLDLDHFKAVNDTYGHPIGDQMLCRVATVCAGLLPPLGLFARLGGEEFGALLPRFNREQALGLAEDMRMAIAAIVVDSPAGKVTISASLGCATLDETEGSIDDLLTLADARSYKAKRAGRNRVFQMDQHLE